MRLACLFILAVSTSILAQEKPESLQNLLKTVKSFQQQEAKQNQKRLHDFIHNKKQQEKRLQQAKANWLKAQQAGNPLQQQVDANSKTLADLQQRLQQQKNQLGDIVAIYQEFSGDIKTRLNDSLISAEHPKRQKKLQNLQQQGESLALNDLKTHWLLLLEEMTQASENTRFNAQVIQTDGAQKKQQVLRLGTFTAFSEGQFLQFSPEQNRLFVLARQPNQQQLMITFEQATKNNNEGIAQAVIDPSRGHLLRLLSLAPNLYERLLQGKEVGFAIIIMAALGLLFALYRALVLLLASQKIKQQLKNISTPQANNALGRVLLQGKNTSDEDQLQLQLDEAILKELPGIERGLSLIKLLAAVAPLLGLLGTVIGMISTFQSISLFGSGDPKLMAGGISQALVTTVLGLLAAIPLLFSHNFLTALAKNMIQVLDEQSAGLLARQKHDDE